MKNVAMPITSIDVGTDWVLKAREAELDRKLLNDPRVVAQRVERELIKRLQETAPWLLPMVIK